MDSSFVRLVFVLIAVFAVLNNARRASLPAGLHRSPTIGLSLSASRFVPQPVKKQFLSKMTCDWPQRPILIVNCSTVNTSYIYL